MKLIPKRKLVGEISLYQDFACFDGGSIQPATIIAQSIKNLTITNAKIATLDALKITTGYLSADRIEAGSIDAKIANIDYAKITNVAIDTADIVNLAVTSAKVTALDAGKITTGTLVVARTQAKCTDPNADQTSAHPQAATWLSTAIETAQLGSTIIVGGYIKTGLVSADNIVTGTLTGVTISQADGGVIIDAGGITIIGQLLEFKDGVNASLIYQTGDTLRLGGYNLILGASNEVTVGAVYLRPVNTNYAGLGSGSKYWHSGFISRVYAPIRLKIPVGANLFD